VELLDSPSTVLDYGCGNGRFASKVSQLLGIPVDACDVNAAAIAKAELEPGVRPHLISSDAPRLPIETGQFDAVTCCAGACTGGTPTSNVVAPRAASRCALAR
jgi:ubiquinone/menaquinone biosynthesis C-methylase UbiE